MYGREQKILCFTISIYDYDYAVTGNTTMLFTNCYYAYLYYTLRLYVTNTHTMNVSDLFMGKVKSAAEFCKEQW